MFKASNNDRWTRRFFALAEHIAQWSKDPSTQVGAVIVDELRRVIATGYNGFPRGVVDSADRYADRALKYPMIVHAEANAILTAVANVKGATLIATMPPCAECAKLIIQSGIRCVVAPKLSNDRWTDSTRHAMTMFSEAGVTMVELDLDVDSRSTAPARETVPSFTVDDVRAMLANPLENMRARFPALSVQILISGDDPRAWVVWLHHVGASPASIVVRATEAGLRFAFLGRPVGLGEIASTSTIATLPEAIGAAMGHFARHLEPR